MRGKITWERVEKLVQDKISLPHSKWALRARPEIKSSYDARRAQLKADKVISKAAMPKLPNDPAGVIADLQAKVHALHEQLCVVLDNAVELGIPLERINRPPNPTSYSPTPRDN